MKFADCDSGTEERKWRWEQLETALNNCANVFGDPVKLEQSEYEL